MHRNGSTSEKKINEMFTCFAPCVFFAESFFVRQVDVNERSMGSKNKQRSSIFNCPILYFWVKKHFSNFRLVLIAVAFRLRRPVFAIVVVAKLRREKNVLVNRITLFFFLRVKILQECVMSLTLSGSSSSGRSGQLILSSTSSV